MSKRIQIYGGRLIDPAHGVDRHTDLYLAEGLVVGIGQAPDGFVADLLLDASGCWVLPGLVDLSVRLGEPGQEHKSTVASELAAAAAGGVTTVCCAPDTRPIIDTPAVVELINQRAEDSGQARVVCLGALTRKLEGEVLAEMAALAHIGCVGVSNARMPVRNTAVQRRAFEYAANFGLTVFLQAEDPWLAADGCAHEGAVATRLGLPGIPETAETIALARDLLLIEQTGVRAHFGRLSSAQAVELIAVAKRRGLKVSADVGIHHLHFTDEDLEGYNASCHLRPPLRRATDRAALRVGLARRLVDAICSDHEPQDRDAKSSPFAATEPGATGLETLLPLTLRLVGSEILNLSTAIAALTSQPAAILGQNNLGQLGLGSAADVCVFDPSERWTVSEESLITAGKNTPCLGEHLLGRTRYTVFAGRVVYGL